MTMTQAEMIEAFRIAQEHGYKAGWEAGERAATEVARRERIATAALQGLLAHKLGEWTEYTQAALACADALIAALGKEQP